MGLFGSKFKPLHTVKLVQYEPPTINLSKASVSLKEQIGASADALKDQGLEGIRLDVELYIDRSGSMSPSFSDGSVQQLVERVLAFAVNVDADGSVPVTAWHDRPLPTVNATLDNYPGFVDREIQGHGWGGTSMWQPLAKAIQSAKSNNKPTFVVFVGDGQPTDSTAKATEQAYASSQYPMFIKFLSIGEGVPLLSTWDTAGNSKRLLDNINAKSLTRQQLRPAAIGGMSDEEFAELMVDEFADWLKKAEAAGLVTR